MTGEHSSNNYLLFDIFTIATQGKPNIAESFRPISIGDIRQFGDRNNFFSNNKKRVGVRNDDMSNNFIYKVFSNRLKWRESSKCVELSTPPNAIK